MPTKQYGYIDKDIVYSILAVMVVPRVVEIRTLDGDGNTSKCVAFDNLSGIQHRRNRSVKQDSTGFAFSFFHFLGSIQLSALGSLHIRRKLYVVYAN